MALAPYVPGVSVGGVASESARPGECRRQHGEGRPGHEGPQVRQYASRTRERAVEKGINLVGGRGRGNSFRAVQQRNGNERLPTCESNAVSREIHIEK